MFDRLTNVLKSGVSIGALRISLEDHECRQRREAEGLVARIHHKEQDAPPPEPTVEQSAYDAVAMAVEPATPKTIAKAVSTINDTRRTSEDPAPAPKFMNGDAVYWTSSNTRKSGLIVAVIPAGSLPGDFKFKLKDADAPRDHESYVVKGWRCAANGDPVEGSTRLYWPRVSLLTR